MYKNLINLELNEIKNTLENFCKNKNNIFLIEKSAILIANCFISGNKVLSCGNGGSHCDAIHFAEELTGRYRKNRKGYPALAISDIAHFSSISNDFGFEYVFSRYIESIGKNGDVLLAISTSGNSKNIINAINVAKIKNMKVIFLTGKDGGNAANCSDVEIRVLHSGYADRIQEIHIKIIHIIISIVEKIIENKK